MLIRAQNNYGKNLFDAAYTLSESGSLDNQTGLAIKAVIKYHKSDVGFSILTPKPTGNILMSPFTDPNAVIFPDDTNYIFLLKCSLAPICLIPGTQKKIDFHNDMLVTQALAGKITFAAFKTAAEAKDGTTCATADGSSSYYTIDAGIVFEADAIAVLNKIGEEYFKRTKKKFNVNSGTRDAYRQAAAMYVKYPKDPIFSEYRKYHLKLVNEIILAVNGAKAAGKSNDGIVQAMTNTIQNQIDRHEYISNHLIAGALDIAIVDKGIKEPGIAPQNREQFKAAVKKVVGKSSALEGNPPHYHIDFK